MKLRIAAGDAACEQSVHDRTESLCSLPRAGCETILLSASLYLGAHVVDVMYVYIIESPHL